jgi:hypothetical protein
MATTVSQLEILARAASKRRSSRKSIWNSYTKTT